MHTVNNRTQLICCVYILYGAGELTITQPYFFHATSVAIYPLGTHVARTSATEQWFWKEDGNTGWMCFDYKISLDCY